MPDKDYYGEWVSWLDKGGGSGAPPAPSSPATASAGGGKGKDYMAEWSAWLDKQTVPAPEQNPQSIAAFVASKISDPKMFPGIERIVESVKGANYRGVDVGNLASGVQKNADAWGRMSGLPNPNDYGFDPSTFGMRRRESAPYRSVMEEGPGLAGIGTAIQEQAKGLVEFLPDLALGLATNPAQTIEERLPDILMAVEGFAGPKLRARIQNAKANLSRGGISTEELSGIIKEAVSEAPTWQAPPAAPTPAPAPTPTPVAPPAPAPMPTPEPVPVAPKAKRMPKAKEANAVAPAAKEPWQMTREEFVAEAPSGYKITKLPGEDIARANPDGTISVDSEKFFGHGIKERQDILAHEKAHFLEEKISPEYKARLFDNKAVMSYRGRNINEKLANMIQDGTLPPEVLADYPDLALATAQAPPKPLSITSGDMGMSLSEFEKARSTGEQVTGYTGRKVPGLGLVMVDGKTGKPLTMAEFVAKKSGKNIAAAEDLAVSLMGSAKMPEPPPAAPLTAQQQLVAAARSASKLTPEQAAIYSKERGRRMGSFEQSSLGLTGEQKALARRRSQAGEMEKVGWEPIRGKFTKDAVDGFYDMIDRDSRLNGFEKLSTDTALTKILDGQLPQPAEIDKLKLVFGKDLADVLVAKRDTMSMGMRLLLEAGNLPRSMMASFDLSAPLRQGVFMVSHPKEFAPAFGNMFKQFFSEKAYTALQNEITQRPTFKLMQDAKLGITDATRFISSREERFASSIADRLPIIGKGVRASERAYVGFLNKLRADTFDSLIQMTERRGMSPYENPELVRQIGGIINNMTGRGSLKNVGLERAANMANSLFFSPRLMASRVAMLNPVTYAKLPKGVRSWAIKTAIADAGIGVTVLGMLKAAGAEVNLDFGSPDFGKAKFGNTRVDIWGGFSQYARTMLQVANGLRQQYITGEKPDRNPLEALSTFVQYKEAPAVSYAAGLLRGKTMTGEKFNPAKEVGMRLIPMMIQDMDDLLRDDPSQLAWITPGLFGVGVQTYEEKPKKKASLW